MNTDPSGAAGTSCRPLNIVASMDGLWAQSVERVVRKGTPPTLSLTISSSSPAWAFMRSTSCVKLFRS